MVGDAQEYQVLVRIPREHSPARLGDLLDVSGVVRTVPDRLRSIGLSLDQLQLAEQQELYVSASSILIAGE